MRLRVLDERRGTSRARTLVLAALVAAVSIALLPSSAAADPSTPTPTAEQVARARAAAQAAAAELSAADAARASAQKQLAALDARIEAQVERWNAARAEAEAARTTAALAQRDAATARVASLAAQADVDRLAVASYQVGADLSGGLGEWAAIIDSAFGPGGIQGLADRTTAVTQVTADRRRDLDSARELALVALQQEAAAARAAADLAAREQEVAAAAEALRTEQESQRGEVARLVAIRDAASATLDAAQSRAGDLARTRAAALARAAAAARAAAKARAEAERRARERERETGGQVPRDDGTSRSWPDGRSVTTTAQRRGALAFAIRQIGDPYVAGENGPDAYDCSGLTQAAYRSVGHDMIQYSVAQFAAGRKIPVGQLQPGDLVFYASDTSDWTTIHHVGIYESGGIYVEAPHTGDVVKRLTIWTDGLMAYGVRP
jgi:cell wall-associated NlpC family hydrolase